MTITSSPIAFDPYSFGAQIIGASIMEPNISAAEAFAFTKSGAGIFEPQNKIRNNPPLVDFSDNTQVLVLAAFAIGAVFVFKRYLK